jgi:hypothetical protein
MAMLSSLKTVPELGIRRTQLSIEGGSFLINGRPTYEGRSFRGWKIEGLLMNSRMANGIFDDLNGATRGMWKYPNINVWDPERNTREFVEAMPTWRQHGLLSFTINLQGGNPRGYTREQPWQNSSFHEDGTRRQDYFRRLRKILNAADDLGMAPIVGCFYFGQDQRLRDEAAVIRALEETAAWILESGYRNTVLEVNNECNIRYHHSILGPERVHELISRAKNITRRGDRLLVGTSFSGGVIPSDSVVEVSDLILLHGNRVENPEVIADMVTRVRRLESYREKPILFNEDDHYDFDRSNNNMVCAVSAHASWGYLDVGENNYRDGYQSPPVNWSINTERKRNFFGILTEMTGNRGGRA